MTDPSANLAQALEDKIHKNPNSHQIRRANELELIAICVALRARYHQDDYILDRCNFLTVDEIMIREDYISDGPSFCGKVAVIFWGEACFLTVLGDNGCTDTNWEVIDQEV